MSFSKFCYYLYYTLLILLYDISIFNTLILERESYGITWQELINTWHHWCPLTLVPFVSTPIPPWWYIYVDGFFVLVSLSTWPDIDISSNVVLNIIGLQPFVYDREHFIYLFYTIIVSSHERSSIHCLIQIYNCLYKNFLISLLFTTCITLLRRHLNLF